MSKTVQIPPIVCIGNDWYIIENWDYEIKPDQWLVLRPLNEDERRFAEKRIQDLIEDAWANMTGTHQNLPAK